MTAILAIAATATSLRAAIRDPVLRLRVQLEYLEYRGAPDAVAATCMVDDRPVPTLTPPDNVADALRLVARFADARAITVAAVAHLFADGRPARAELIDESLLVKLDDRVALAAQLAAIDAARVLWPEVPHIACFGTEPDIEAMMDRQARALLHPPDDRVERMLADPRGYFASARERARAEVERDIAGKAAGARSR